jgi:hypothetical protein
MEQSAGQTGTDLQAAQAQIHALQQELTAAKQAATALPVIPTPPAGEAIQMKVAAQVQSLRSGISAQRSQVTTDEERWRAAEVAFGNAVQKLLAMVHQAPKYSDGIYSVLGELRGILDTGKELVQRNRQLLDSEETALKEFEKSICE